MRWWRRTADRVRESLADSRLPRHGLVEMPGVAPAKGSDGPLVPFGDESVSSGPSVWDALRALDEVRAGLAMIHSFLHEHGDCGSGGAP